MDRNEEFRRRQLLPENERNLQNNRQNPTRVQQRNDLNRTRYTAQKGTAHRVAKEPKRIKAKTVALLMAALVGVGTLSFACNSKSNESEPITITQMQEDGVALEASGLSSRTIELFEKYDEYFEKFNPKKQSSITDNHVIGMIDEIESLHFSVVKEKMGALLGEDVENIKMYYDRNTADGQEVRVIINEGKYNQEVYSNLNKSFFGLGGKNTIPDELADVIFQLDPLENLVTELKEDKITKVNAIKELKELYENLEQVATGRFIKDEKGNISIIQYEINNMEKNNEDNEIGIE